MNANATTHRRHVSTETIPDHTTYPRRKTIILYSPDIDFCVSFQMLLEDRYNVVTTTDLEMILMLVNTFHPELLIADVAPTRRMCERFEMIRSQEPATSIMMFYASFPDRTLLSRIHNTVDVLFSKPIDVTEVTHRIREILMTKG